MVVGPRRRSWSNGRVDRPLVTNQFLNLTLQLRTHAEETDVRLGLPRLVRGFDPPG